MGAVEDGDLAPSGKMLRATPQVVVVELLRGRALEAVYGHTLRVHTAHHVFDGAVLAAGIDTLDDDEQPVRILGGQSRLEIGEELDAAPQKLLALLLPNEIGGGRRVEVPSEVHLPARLDAQTLRKLADRSMLLGHVASPPFETSGLQSTISRRGIGRDPGRRSGRRAQLDLFAGLVGDHDHADLAGAQHVPGHGAQDEIAPEPAAVVCANDRLCVRSAGRPKQEFSRAVVGADNAAPRRPPADGSASCCTRAVFGHQSAPAGTARGPEGRAAGRSGGRGGSNRMCPPRTRLSQPDGFRPGVARERRTVKPDDDPDRHGSPETLSEPNLPVPGRYPKRRSAKAPRPDGEFVGSRRRCILKLGNERHA